MSPMNRYRWTRCCGPWKSMADCTWSCWTAAASTRSSGAGVARGPAAAWRFGGRGPRGTLIAFSTAPNTEAKMETATTRRTRRSWPACCKVAPRRVWSWSTPFVRPACAVKHRSGQTPWLNMEASLPRFNLVRPRWAPDRTNRQRWPRPPWLEMIRAYSSGNGIVATL